MKPITGYLVKDKNRNGFKAIVEYEGSNNRFYPSYPNTKKEVKIRKATNEDLYSALFFIGVRLITEKYEENIEMIAEKFYKELATNSFLCYDEATNKGFFVIIE